MRLICFHLLLLVSIYFQSADGITLAASPYRIEGVVTDAATKEPVANTTVQVLITSEPDPAKKIRKGQTDDKGLYSIELPAGHAWAWYLELPDGYCAGKQQPDRSLRDHRRSSSLYEELPAAQRSPDQGRRSLSRHDCQPSQDTLFNRPTKGKRIHLCVLRT